MYIYIYIYVFMGTQVYGCMMYVYVHRYTDV